MLNRDFKEFIKSLNDNNVRYLVVGGYAVALHGYPRYTKDLDIWIDATTENAEKIVKTLDQFGFDSLQLKAEDFLPSDTMFPVYPFTKPTTRLLINPIHVIIKLCYKVSVPLSRGAHLG